MRYGPEACGVHEVFSRAQVAILTRLEDTTVADILGHADFESLPGVREAAVAAAV